MGIMSSEYIPISVAVREKKYLWPLNRSTVSRLCKAGLLVAAKFGDNRKGKGRWHILRSSIIQHKINNHQT
jgi:hypothetical protein